MTNTIDIYVRGAKITLRPRTYFYKDSWSEYSKAPRMYVSVADETILDNLQNRKRRPYNVYKTLIHSSDLHKVIDTSVLQWSQKAGCTMCPCSPGFILNRHSLTIEGQTYTNFDLWIELESAPAVDERKLARVI